MKKLILLTLAILIFFSLIFAQTTTPTTSTSKATTTKPVKQPKAVKPYKSKAKGVAGVYEKCLNVEMQRLTKEKQSREKTALAEYKNNLKSATSTQAKREARKSYNNALRDIKKWFNQSTKEAREKCRLTATSTPTKTPTSTPTSKATSTQ
jgi:Skp family chaperone for outer membrane proteins